MDAKADQPLNRAVKGQVAVGEVGGYEEADGITRDGKRFAEGSRTAGESRVWCLLAKKVRIMPSVSSRSRRVPIRISNTIIVVRIQPCPRVEYTDYSSISPWKPPHSLAVPASQNCVPGSTKFVEFSPCSYNTERLYRFQLECGGMQVDVRDVAYFVMERKQGLRLCVGSLPVRFFHHPFADFDFPWLP
jgi:hypothetical protein